MLGAAEFGNAIGNVKHR